MQSNDVFAVEISDKVLLYAPRHNVTALVNRPAAQAIRAGFSEQSAELPARLLDMVARLRQPGRAAPPVRTGALTAPLFLGLIPTRGCNLGCRYCDFAAPKTTSPIMDVALARSAIDAYFDLLCAHGRQEAEVHFFGGEPFYAAEVVHFAVDYAILQAAKLGLTVRFEATTNGLYGALRSQWIADHFDTIVLSFDGPPDIQERQRPALGDGRAFETVAQSASIFSAAPMEFILRACVTNESVARLPEIALWFAENFRPDAVCFETLMPSPLAEAAGLTSPDPYAFAWQFDAAAELLKERGISTVLSTADLSVYRARFCPVGQDALIVSPDGNVDACYLLESDWEQRGLEMRLGRVAEGGFKFAPGAVDRVRALADERQAQCAHCLCRYHCAGGCLVNHHPSAPGQFNAMCSQTRLITLIQLLKQLGQTEALRVWQLDPAAQAKALWQPTDRLAEMKL